MASRIINHLVNEKFKLGFGSFGTGYAKITALNNDDAYDIDVTIDIDDEVNGIIVVNERRIEIEDLPIDKFMERYLR